MMWNQLKVILWKNLIIRKRHWFLTLCEALIPVALFILIAYGRSKITNLSKKQIIDATHNEKYDISYYQNGFNLEETQLYFSPSNYYFTDLIHRVQEKFQIINNNIQGFNDEKQLLEQYAKSHNGTIIAIIFNSKKDSPNFDYTIRHHRPYFSWKTEVLYENEYLFQPGQGTPYLWEGFLSLQKALDMSFIEKENEKQNGTNLPEMFTWLQEFPYPPYSSDAGIMSVFVHYLPLITLFSFVFVCPAVLKRVVEEKYSGIKELMRMVGMKSGIFWSGWFIYSIIPMIISVSCIVLILKVDLFDASYPPIEYTSGGVLFVFLLLYCVTITINSFFISSLFYKPTLATLVGLLIWILSYFVPKYLMGEGGTISLTANMFIMLLPNMALHYGYLAISQYEIREIGVQWSNWHVPGGNGDNEVSMARVCIMLVVDCVVYFLLALYIDGINPGKYGVPKSVWFPFKWMGSCLKPRPNNVDSANNETIHLAEVEKGKIPKGIELVNLTKVYDKKRVVNKLSMEIYEGQITVLLGHNGAGKSTTMGMITGMIKKSGGHVLMNGKEIRSSSDVTQSIGLCPQHNLFFPDLTVGEHLKFFAMLKGKSCLEAEKELNKLLEDMNLLEKKNDLAHTLSGGMKRKLCLGMAVIGGSKILILDEPSSGMDPQSRRHMWDLLLQWRNKKTILITTHFMEEADALGDWIAIMNEGELKCFGTPMFLKKKYNTGSNLILLIEKSQDIDGAANVIKQQLEKFIEKVDCKSINGNEVQFLISSGNYVEMFKYLENNKWKLHIENISFTNTTLEDVFLNSKVANEQAVEEKSSNLNTIDSRESSNYILTLNALLFKRYRFIYRKFKSYIIPLIIAIGFLVLCIFLGEDARDYSSTGGPMLKLALSVYGKTSVFLKTANQPNVVKMGKFYENSVNREKSHFQLVNDVSESIIEEGIKNLPFYRRHMAVAAELNFENGMIEATALFNNLARHSSPIALNLITDSFAKLVLGDQYSINTNIYPLNNINPATSSEQLSEVQIGLLWLIIMPLGFLFFLGSFIYFPFVELSTKFTQLQFMCGVSPVIYWFITYLSDLVVYVTFALVMAIISMAWTPFAGINEFGALLLILVLYGVSSIPFSYLFGRKKSFSAAYALFIILGLMLGVLLTVTVLALEESGDEGYVGTSQALRAIFMIVCPQFGLTYSGVRFSRKVINNYNFAHMDSLRRLGVCSMEKANACCSGNIFDCDKSKSYLAVLHPFVWYGLIGAVLYLFLNVFLDSYLQKKITNFVCNLLRPGRRNVNYKSLNSDVPDQIDENVPKWNNTDTLRVKKLRKSYSGREVVNNVSLDLKKGECMGILGVNGAGKTTTFRMLTREEVKDTGVIQINNVNIDDGAYLKKLGYCPQNNALNLSLTGRDMLRTMALLRGISSHEVVNKFLEIFELTDLADIPCEKYSGGNKRKLCFAIAVIGFPEFILLDEPTSGVDPLSRRKFWTLIKQIKDKKQNSFILTSHSMTECEAVCNNLKIMKEGTIRKEGTISKLKSEMAGFSVMLKLKHASRPDQGPTKKPKAEEQGFDEVDGGGSTVLNQEDRDKQLHQLKELLLKDGEIRDEHSGLLHVYIKSKDKNWAELFQKIETLKQQFSFIEDYSISEASLEDVFLAVAQPEEKKKDFGC